MALLLVYAPPLTITLCLSLYIPKGSVLWPQDNHIDHVPMLGGLWLIATTSEKHSYSVKSEDIPLPFDALVSITAPCYFLSSANHNL